MPTDQDKIAELMKNPEEDITLLIEGIEVKEEFPFTKEGIKSLSKRLDKMVEEIKKSTPGMSESVIRTTIAREFKIELKASAKK